MRPLQFSPNRRTARIAGLAILAGITVVTGCGRLRGWFESRNGSGNSHSVTIAWTASAFPVQGYNVYRSSPPGPPVRITVRLVSEATYTDKSVEAGRTYVYYVTSVDSKGTESSPSQNITVTHGGFGLGAGLTRGVRD
jgi:hypothetical protein